jgi:hypothetical protein
VGKLTLLEGDPGQGKSWVAAVIAASGSVGCGLPGMESFEPFRSVFFGAEDGKADTFRPSLDALGANARPEVSYGGQFLKCQTSTASPAEPVGLPW